jgi:hypothetical protein
VQAIGDDADGADEVPERQLRDRDGEIEEKNPDEYSGDGSVARRDRRR